MHTSPSALIGIAGRSLRLDNAPAAQNGIESAKVSPTNISGDLFCIGKVVCSCQHILLQNLHLIMIRAAINPHIQVSRNVITKKGTGL
jgi:hypothetical protein